MTRRLFLGVDQGTTSTAALLLDEGLRVVGRGRGSHRQYYPRPGWVEHEPAEVWSGVLAAVGEACAQAEVRPGEVVCMGLANQGETCLVWDRRTGQPLCRAIVWQDKRTAERAEELSGQCGAEIRQRTGLVPDAYFSATKLAWMLENVEGAADKLRSGDLLGGTLDSWLIWKLTGGALHATDVSTASRTMLMNLGTEDWDEEILGLLGIPRAMLPRIGDSAGPYGRTDPRSFTVLPDAVPIMGAVADQQAALFGLGCLDPGSVKATYGTGCFMLMNVGGSPVHSRHGLLNTVAWRLNGRTDYALDAGVYTAGAAVHWLRDQLGLVDSPEHCNALAGSVEDSGGVYFVPAFSGLAAPHWDQYARGTIVGLTGACTREHLARATLEGIAHQVHDNYEAMLKDSGREIPFMRVDGGLANSSVLMQFQADILGIPIEVPEETEVTALGAAALAAYGIGAFSTPAEAVGFERRSLRYEPRMSRDERAARVGEWRRAVERSARWARRDSAES